MIVDMKGGGLVTIGECCEPGSGCCEGGDDCC
jgi:hypothetical protein